MKIRYKTDVLDPPSQRGSIGDIKEVGVDISASDAKLLFNGDHIEEVKEKKKKETSNVEQGTDSQ